MQQRTELVLDVAPTVPSCVLCDQMLLQRVLMNLVTNALKFCDEGRVTLSVVWGAEQGKLSVVVSDTGIGMTEEEQQGLFQKFFQGGHGRGGTGLGLVVCQQLVTQMGGTIAASSPGKGLGSRFSFDVVAPVVKSLGGWLSCTAAVVDGDVARREALVNMLRYVGAAVLPAGARSEEPHV